MNIFLWLNQAFNHTLTYTCLGPFVWCHLTYHRWYLSPNTQTTALWHSQDLSGYPEKSYQIFSIFSSITRHFLNFAILIVKFWIEIQILNFHFLKLCSCIQNSLQNLIKSIQYFFKSKSSDRNNNLLTNYDFSITTYMYIINRSSNSSN